MKHFFSGILIAFTLVAVLITGVIALAENAAPEIPELPSVEESQPEQAQPEQDAQQPAADASSDNTALQDAFDAYRAARQSDQQEELEAELKSYVASGKLTQEQADLILNYYKEQEALRNGTCPNCGYQFQNGFGKGGHGMGGRGMKGGKGGRMFGGMNMPGQQPSTQSGTDSQASGTAFEFGAQTIPFMDDTEGI
ncbi:MAG: hypothetical protein IKN05_06055 [Clostridia bacterium]|nr:hypothetical protein [Clostridia bacterium]